MLSVFWALVFVAAPLSSSENSARALPTNPPDCVKYYHAACSEALGAWLPTFALSNAFWDDATRVSKRDAFAYKDVRPTSSDLLGMSGPSDGTFFTYGNAGPPKGHVVYDYAHGITFYDQGCCGWRDVVEAYAAPPPKRVVNRDLRALKTLRGIALGMSAQEVRRTYGPASLKRVSAKDGVSVLSYTTWPPRRQVTIVKSPCGQFQNFYFKHDRLVLIQLGNGC